MPEKEEGEGAAYLVPRANATQSLPACHLETPVPDTALVNWTMEPMVSQRCSQAHLGVEGEEGPHVG